MARAVPPPAVTLAGQETRLLDSLMPALYRKALTGDSDAVDRILRVLEMRLRFERARKGRRSIAGSKE